MPQRVDQPPASPLPSAPIPGAPKGETVAEKSAIQRIMVRVHVGEHMLSATDDPVFLGLRGPAGREFRLDFPKGKSMRKGSNDSYIFGSPNDPQTNVAHPELNDPSEPALHSEDISSIFLRKGFDPIPNVRAMGEMDDRLEVHEIAVEFQFSDGDEPVCFFRSGPLWLGLVCGLRMEIPRTDSDS
jgi:hypothetical protein